MAKIKSYTDFPQSEALSKILSHESADMWYHGHGSPWKSERTYDEEPASYHSAFPQWDKPCWSLSALLGVLPLVDFTTPQLIGTPKTLYRCVYNDDLKSHAHDNAVDACYEMIIRLNELKIL